MRRWDQLVEGYERRMEARGLQKSTMEHRCRELERWGAWLKRRRPKVQLESIDSEILVKYIRSRTAFHSKATVCGVVSIMKCMGDYLLEEGVWVKNPMRWIRGPKLRPWARLPKRIGAEHLTRIWDSVRLLRENYSQQLALALLGVLYGTGLRRGELERLNVEDWKSGERILRIDGQKSGKERAVPVSTQVWQCMEAYLPHRQNLLERRNRLDERALLINRQGARIVTCRSLTVIFAELWSKGN